MAQIGDVLTVEGATLRVTAMDGLRIDRISISPAVMEDDLPSDEQLDE